MFHIIMCNSIQQLDSKWLPCQLIHIKTQFEEFCQLQLFLLYFTLLIIFNNFSCHSSFHHHNALPVAAYDKLSILSKDSLYTIMLISFHTCSFSSEYSLWSYQLQNVLHIYFCRGFQKGNEGQSPTFAKKNVIYHSLNI